MLQMLLMLIGKILLLDMEDKMFGRVDERRSKSLLKFSRGLVTLTLQTGVSPVKLLTFSALLPPKPWMAAALASELQRTGRDDHRPA